MSCVIVVVNGVVYVTGNSKDIVAVEFVYCLPAGLRLCHNVSAVSAIILA